MEDYNCQRLEARGIPIRPVWELAVAHEIVDSFEELKNQSVEKLQALSRGKGWPFAVLHDHSELVSCVFAVMVWERLPMTELKRLCKHSSAFHTNPDGQCGLIKQLMDSLWLDMIIARGLPTQRLGQREIETVFSDVLQLELFGPAELEAEYIWVLKRIGVPPEAGAESRYHRACLTSIRVWEALALPELIKDCKAVSDSEDLGLDDQYTAQLAGYDVVEKKESEQMVNTRQRLLQTLCVRVLCKERWDARGIDVDSLTVAAALRVAEKYEVLDDLGESELIVEYESLGMLEDMDDVSCEDMLNRLRAVAVWEEMTLKELVRTCQKVGVHVQEGLENLQHTAKDREHLMMQLKLGMCLSPLEAARWEEKGIPVKRLGTIHASTKVITQAKFLEAMPPVTLQHEYEKVALPLEAGSFPSESKVMLARLMDVACWDAFPLHELQRECDDAGASNGGFRSDQSVCEKKHILIERLRVARWADKWHERRLPIKQLGTISAISEVAKEFTRLESMSYDGLNDIYSTLAALPACAFTPPGSIDQLLVCVKRIIIWKNLIVGELREACMELGISFRIDCKHDDSDAEQRELVERLVMASCANKWEERGMPVKKIRNIKEAIELQSRWDELEQSGVKHLRLEYAKLGLPSESVTPKVLELLPRLRLASLWKSLPAAELAQECRKAGVLTSSGDDHARLWQELVLATWGPPRSSSPRSGSKKPASDDAEPQKSEFRQEIGRCFRIMGLPANANVQDLKRAYRKLVLVHHPDKNAESEQEASTKKFRELVKAYEALNKFMIASK